MFTVGPADDNDSAVFVEMFAVTTVESEDAFIAATLNSVCSRRVCYSFRRRKSRSSWCVCRSTNSFKWAESAKEKPSLSTLEISFSSIVLQELSTVNVLEVTMTTVENRSILCAFKWQPTEATTEAEDRVFSSDALYNVDLSTGRVDDNCNSFWTCQSLFSKDIDSFHSNQLRRAHGLQPAKRRSLHGAGPNRPG